jgi:hypothetical protein
MRLLLVAFALVLGCGGATPPTQDGGPIDAPYVPEDVAPPPPPDAAGDRDAPPADAAPVDADPSQLSLSNLTSRLEASLCAYAVRCGFAPDLATCGEATVPASGVLPTLISYAMMGRLLFDVTAAQACLDAYEVVPCDFDAPVPPVCDDVFTGPVGEGNLCTVDEECVGDATCDQPACEGDCCTGVCVARPAPVSDGEDCAAAPCVPASYCAGGGTCQPRIALGLSCAAAPDGCVEGAFCSSGSTCVAYSDEGEACDPAAPFQGGCRRWDNYCSPMTGTCVTRLAPGAACNTDPADRCMPYAICDGSVCVARPSLGDPCTTFGAECLIHLACEAGSCQAPDPSEVCP